MSEAITGISLRGLMRVASWPSPVDTPAEMFIAHRCDLQLGQQV